MGLTPIRSDPSIGPTKSQRNKAVHVFFVEKVIMFDFFLLGHDSTGLLTFICCCFTKTKFVVLCFLTWIAYVESYIMLGLVLPVVAPPQVIQWSSEKGHNYEGDI